MSRVTESIKYMNWYAVQTKPRQEATARQHLLNQQFNPFLPMFRLPKKIAGRWKSKVEPLFPGYLFVELDVENQNTAPIRSTRGVMRLVRQGSRVAPVPESLITELKRAHGNVDGVVDCQHGYKFGDEVVITDGPMKGLKAIYKSQNSEERVILLLNILGGETCVTIPRHSLARGS